MRTAAPPEAAFGAIACGTRRTLLDTLAEGERTVGELVGVAGISQPAVSEHLRVLRRAGLVSVRSEGRFRYYRVRGEPLAAVMDWVRSYERFWSGRLAALGRVLAGERRRKP